MKLHTFFYRVARTANNLDALANPERAGRRVRNIFLGRLIGKIFKW
jgi:hypothetical protein